MTDKLKYILCIYPYKKELSSAGFMPPIGLESIAKTASEFSEKIKIVDMRFEDGNLSRFMDPLPDAVLISVNWYYEKKKVKELIRSIPSGILTIVGGREATETTETLLQECPNIDIIVRGEGEKTIREILQNNPLHEIKGISYNCDGKVINNPMRGMDDLSHFYKIGRNLRDYKYQFKISGINFGYTVDGVFSSRGCPYNCKFCTFNFTPDGEKIKWRGREPEDVVEEIKEIDADFIIFLDENFTHDVKRVERICDLLIEQKIKKVFVSNARIEIYRHPEVLAKMEKAGFRFLTLGIESSQDHVLKQMRKGFTTDDLRKGFAVLRKLNIFSHAYFIIGSPNETKEEMLNIADFAREVGIGSIGVSNLRCAPTSPMYAEIKGLSGYHIDKKERVYSDKYSVSDIKEIRKTIYGKFYTASTLWKIFAFFVSNGLLTPKLLLNVARTSINPFVLASQNKKKNDVKKARKILKQQSKINK